MIFLKERSLPPVLCCSSNAASAKRKRNGLRMKHQYSASSVSRSFFLLIFRQSLVSVRGCLSSVWQAVTRFSGRIRSAGGRFCPKRPCRLTLPLPSEPHATFASVRRKQVAGGMYINYTMGCYPCHKRRTLLLELLSWWRRFHLLQTV